MNRKRSIFFAYEWSPPFAQFYKTIAQPYKKSWDIRIGPNITTTPKLSGDIEKYRNRNKQLFDLFARNIQESNIFIADITTVNPNVMLELGIAIKLNKNILVVSGASNEKTPFNIKGVEIEFYKSFEELRKKIREHIKMYVKIKDMDFSDKVPGNYFVIPSGKETSDPQTIIDGSVDSRSFRIIELFPKMEKMRDTKLRVSYRIIKSYDQSDWFGFMFRSKEHKGAFEPVNYGSIMVNARVNGNTDVTLYPGQIIPRAGKTHKPHDKINFRYLEVTLDNEYIKVCGDDGCFEFEPLGNINFGFLYLVCFRCEVEYKDLKILNIDTTSEIA